MRIGLGQPERTPVPLLCEYCNKRKCFWRWNVTLQETIVLEVIHWLYIYLN